MTILDLIGVASCLGAQDQRCALAPEWLVKMGVESRLQSPALDVNWQEIIYPPNTAALSPLTQITQVCDELSELTYQAVVAGHQFGVFGGDHSCAIGTWSGVVDAIKMPGSMGLLWIDAHLDSHLPETSPSHAIHGMPLACLLGHGVKCLRHLRTHRNKLLPKNTCVIGARSFEAAEVALLELLGVRVYQIQEVQQRGLMTVFQEALYTILKDATYVGVTIDLDVVDPMDAPGVGSPAVDGVAGDKLVQVLRTLRHESRLVGVEITELNPVLDQQQKTAELAIRLLEAVYRT